MLIVTLLNRKKVWSTELGGGNATAEIATNDAQTEIGEDWPCSRSKTEFRQRPVVRRQL
jgi:hypothetical protein